MWDRAERWASQAVFGLPEGAEGEGVKPLHTDLSAEDRAKGERLERFFEAAREQLTPPAPGEECPVCKRKMPSKNALRQAAWRARKK